MCGSHEVKKCFDKHGSLWSLCFTCVSICVLLLPPVQKRWIETICSKYFEYPEIDLEWGLNRRTCLWKFKPEKMNSGPVLCVNISIAPAHFLISAISLFPLCTSAITIILSVTAKWDLEYSGSFACTTVLPTLLVMSFSRDDI